MFHHICAQLMIMDSDGLFGTLVSTTEMVIILRKTVPHLIEIILRKQTAYQILEKEGWIILASGIPG